VLLLFDIDGTLLQDTTRPVAEAMRDALRDVHGIDTTRIRTQIETVGRTDGEIARAILLDSDVSNERIDALARRVGESCCRSSARLLPADLSSAVLPGVRELLDWLADQADVRLGLLTGNYEPIARLKLARAGIGGAFARGQGAFGSDAEDRPARNRPPAGGNDSSPIPPAGHHRDRRHAARHRMCPRGWGALRGGGQRVLYERRAGGC
jgi:phosphoglycolate phosphatase-like HAD superfamily hydrolase